MAFGSLATKRCLAGSPDFCIVLACWFEASPDHFKRCNRTEHTIPFDQTLAVYIAADYSVNRMSKQVENNGEQHPALKLISNQQAVAASLLAAVSSVNLMLWRMGNKAKAKEWRATIAVNQRVCKPMRLPSVSDIGQLSCA